MVDIDAPEEPTIVSIDTGVNGHTRTTDFDSDYFDGEWAMVEFTSVCRGD